MGQELDQLGRFHEHGGGAQAQDRVRRHGSDPRPKPQEPTKHQYDYDCAAVFAFLQKYGLADEIKVNIEVNHADPGRPRFEHEITYAIENGIFGRSTSTAATT